MPGLSGLDVAARLEPPRPRVVFCTAFDQFAIDAFEHHAVDYLLKPINRERLMRTDRAHLRRSRRTAPPDSGDAHESESSGKPSGRRRD